MLNLTDILKVESLDGADDPLHDVSWLLEAFADTTPGQESDLMRLLLSRVAFNNMFQLCAVLDVQGIMWDVNNTARVAADLSRSDIHGKPFWEAGWWQGSPEAPQQLKAAIELAATGKFVRYDVDIVDRAGSQELITIDFSIQPITERGGAVRFFICEGRDVTEHRHFERQLVHQREALARLDEAKTQFFANVSHEFRTPLALMLGPIDEALAETGEPLSAQQRERATMLQRNGLRLHKLVNTLLDFSRVEAGRASAFYQPTDIASLTHDLASSFRSACDKAGLDLVIETPPLTKPVVVDRDMWEKIVLNLISNAFKYTFEGEIRVSIDAEGEHAVLRVSDTGTGIPPEDLSLIFERFHRVSRAHARTHEGTGIGLALVQELTRLQLGSVAVESVLGRGTTFTVRVPFDGAQASPANGEGVSGADATMTNADAFVTEALGWLPDMVMAAGFEGRGEQSDEPRRAGGTRATVLLADDNADMRLYLNRLLTPTYDVISVANGMEALAGARQLRPHLILSDVMMPEVDGFELLHSVRADPELHDIPVILLSAMAGEEAKVEGLRKGANDYLVKPFSARELVARVGVNIELARRRSQLAHEKDKVYRATQEELERHKRIEAALRQSEEELEARVAERTRQLAETARELTVANERLRAEAEERQRVEESLRHAQKMEAIGQLTGGIAHDFNNLLAGITGSLETLRIRAAQGRSGEFHRYIEAGLSSAQRAAGLTKRLLAFSRRQTLDPVPVDANRLVSGMEDLFRQMAGLGVGIEKRLADDLWAIRCDANQLENALLNLVINGRDAMAEGGDLLIETENFVVNEHDTNPGNLPPGEFVAVSVTDTGMGMPPGVAARAFDPFFTTKPVGQGTGLGLAMLYGFVKESGGHVRLRSEEGEGTTATIYFSRYVGEVVDAPAEIAATPSSTMQPGPVVLVVEDEPVVRMVIVDVLADQGYKTLEAGDGPCAFKLLEAGGRIDLLVTDIGLPGGMTGRELARDARTMRPDLKVLFITGHAGRLMDAESNAEDDPTFLAKPFLLDVLAAKVNSLVAA